MNIMIDSAFSGVQYARTSRVFVFRHQLPRVAHAELKDNQSHLPSTYYSLSLFNVTLHPHGLRIGSSLADGVPPRILVGCFNARHRVVKHTALPTPLRELHVSWWHRYSLPTNGTNQIISYRHGYWALGYLRSRVAVSKYTCAKQLSLSLARI